jgi:hypothetical protein
MKSIEDTLKIIQDIIKKFPGDVEIALIGGYAAVLHGIERTTLDIDFCIHSSAVTSSKDSSRFYELLVKCLPDRFNAKMIKGSSMPDDPFKHDVIFIEDKLEEFIRIDFIIAKYKWELEAIHSAEKIPGIPVPVVAKPYLAAMKLRSSGFKDASDVIGLISLMTEEERQKTFELARLTGRDKKLKRLLSPPEEPFEKSSEELI